MSTRGAARLQVFAPVPTQPAPRVTLKITPREVPMRRRFAAVALALALAAGLAACSGSAAGENTPEVTRDQAGDQGQSTADACALVQGSIEEAGEAFASASADDPSSVVDAMRAASDELVSVSAQITNDEVAALLPSLSEMFAQASEAMDAVASGDATRLGEIGEAFGTFEATSARFQELCASG